MKPNNSKTSNPHKLLLKKCRFIKFEHGKIEKAHIETKSLKY